MIATKGKPKPATAPRAEPSPTDPALRPVRSVADLLDRFVALYPWRLGRQTIVRIEDVAGLAVPLRSRDDNGRGEVIRQNLNVASAFLVDEAGLVAADLVPILGRPAYLCEIAQHQGRGWIESYAAEMGRKGKPFDVSPRENGRKGSEAAKRRAMIAGRG